MTVKTQELKIESTSIINTIFKSVIISNDKEVWKKAFNFIDNKINSLEKWERGKELFVWRKVKGSMNHKFWKNFITKK